MTNHGFKMQNRKNLTKYANLEYSGPSDKVIFDSVEKQLKKLPEFVVIKLLAWARSVELKGLREVRKISGYHDEPLKGDRQGQRSIRLTKGYRAFYVKQNDGEINVIIIKEVNKHAY